MFVKIYKFPLEFVGNPCGKSLKIPATLYGTCPLVPKKRFDSHFFGSPGVAPGLPSSRP